MLVRRAWPWLALGTVLSTSSARAEEGVAALAPGEPAAAERGDEPRESSDAPSVSAADPSEGFSGPPGTLEDDEFEDDEFEDDEFEDGPVISVGPLVSLEALPVPPAPVRPRRGDRSGRGLLVAGAVLLGVGTVARFGIEAFWAGPARLEASEPFERWSIPSIVFFTGFANVAIVPGLALTGAGSRRRGRWRGERSLATPDRTRLRRRVGWGLLGGGLGTWALTRALAMPVLRACETNGCAYGYLETSVWASLGMAVPGVVLVGLAAGERGRRSRRVSVAPLGGPHTRGLSLGGRF